MSSSINCRFQQLSSSQGQVIHVLLSLSPLEYPLRGLSARLACLIHAANVHSEPGSNPSINCSLIRPECPKASRPAVEPIEKLVHRQAAPVKGRMPASTVLLLPKRKEFFLALATKLSKITRRRRDRLRRSLRRWFMHSSHIAPRVNTPKKFFSSLLGIPHFTRNRLLAGREESADSGGDMIR